MSVSVCVCGHPAGDHQSRAGTCLSLLSTGRVCSCNAFKKRAVVVPGVGRKRGGARVSLVSPSTREQGSVNRARVPVLARGKSRATVFSPNTDFSSSEKKGVRRQGPQWCMNQPLPLGRVRAKNSKYWEVI